MKATFDTNRLILRPPELDDIANYVALDRDPRVMRYIGDGTVNKDIAAFEKRLRERIPLHQRRVLGLWSVIRKHDHAFCGWAMLRDLDGTEFIEVGYRLAVHAWGQGIATEAARRLIEYAFDDVGLPAITGITHPDNAASQNVLRKCGLRHRGYGRFYGRDNLPFFLITRAEFESSACDDAD